MERIFDATEHSLEDTCYLDDRTGRYSHENSECPVSTGFGWRATCPFETWDNVSKGLPLLAMCFENPKYAKDQNPLNGLAQLSCVQRYS